MREADAGLSIKAIMACLIGLAINHDSLLDFHQTPWCCSSCRWRRLPSHNLGITSGLTQLARTWHKGGETRAARMLHAGDKTEVREQAIGGQLPPFDQPDEVEKHETACRYAAPFHIQAHTNCLSILRRHYARQPQPSPRYHSTEMVTLRGSSGVAIAIVETLEDRVT